MTTGPGPTSLCTGTGRWSAGNSPSLLALRCRAQQPRPCGCPGAGQSSWKHLPTGTGVWYAGPCFGSWLSCPEPSRTHGLGYCSATPKGSLTFLENMSFLWFVKFLPNKQCRTVSKGETEKKARKRIREPKMLSRTRVVHTVAVHGVSEFRSVQPVGRSWARFTGPLPPALTKLTCRPHARCCIVTEDLMG